MNGVINKVARLAQKHDNPDKNVIRDKNIKLGLRDPDGSGVIVGYTTKGKVIGYEKQDLGKQILHSIEQAAKEQPINKILLHAREDATGFYEKQGYTCIKPSHTLYDEIKHFLMEKKIEN